MSFPSAARCLSEISETETVRLRVDLVSAARRTVGFLRNVSACQWLHQKATIVEAIRRYDELWMPLISDLTVGSSPPMVLPPIDVEWVWFRHTLNPVSYRQYCESRFSKLIGKPAIFDEQNEEYALLRCREFWIKRYPSESFENEVDSDSQSPDVLVLNQNLWTEMQNQRFLYLSFSEPYFSEMVYLVAAKQRYRGFLYMLQRFSGGGSAFVPAMDILLMLLTHQSYPTAYVEDVKDIWDGMGKVVGLHRTVKQQEMEETKTLWERTFDQPYEKAGGGLDIELDKAISAKPLVYWDVYDTDVNTRYKSMIPRFTLEVCIFVMFNKGTRVEKQDIKHKFARLRMSRCHRDLKLDKPISTFSSTSWQKAWHVYCEFGTRGVVVELRSHGGLCLKGSKLLNSSTFYWNDLLRASSITLAREVDQLRVAVSITPPVQAPYLLKCVPDRVTDDSGAMISDVILQLNRYRPQEGRWLSRTVLDHAGRECFVVRMRMGGGFWRRGSETPSAVNWEDRIIEVREGSWSYVEGSIGRAPEKVVGTATPKEATEPWKHAWNYSTGEVLMISWASPASASGMTLCLRDRTSSESSSVMLSRGRKMQYQLTRAKGSQINQEEEEADQKEEEEGFVTLVRFTEGNPDGKATALLNWKLLVAEVSPEEDAVLVLLLCVSILRSVSEMRNEDVGGLLVRRRLKEAKYGARDWGSVILHPSSSSDVASPYLQSWHWNVSKVMARDGADSVTGNSPSPHYSAAEGGDQLYKRGILT